MKFTIQTEAGQTYEAYAYTGGKAFDANKPTVVFIHGVLRDHSVWILPEARISRTHGFNVLAVDLPGHLPERWRSAPDSVNGASTSLNND
jgi:pimeloyl-ACP methyl ester carboxylesterase